MALAPVQYVEVEQGAKDLGGNASCKTSMSTFRQQSWKDDPLTRKWLWTAFMILSWYVLSTTLGMYNKIIVGKDKGLSGKGAFPAPLLMSGVQFAFQTLLAKAVFGTGLMKRTASAMTWRDWGRLVLPNGAITGLDIGLSNKSLAFITMSFYTMCKSTTPIFLLLFAFIWGLEKPSWSLVGVVCVIVTGLLLLVKGETKFDLTGFSLVMTAACMSGLRFTLTQVLLHGRSAHGQSPFGGPLEVLEALTPVMAATSLLLSLAFERLWDVLPGSPFFDGWQHCMVTAGIVFLGAVIAFLMVWAEYEVIKQTSALTFMVAGIIKEIVTIVAAVAIFGDKFGWLNGLGMAIAISGVGLFNLYKLRQLRQADISEVVIVRRPSGAAAAAGPGVAALKELQLSGPNGGGRGIEREGRGGSAGLWREGGHSIMLERRRGSGSSSMSSPRTHGSGPDEEDPGMGPLEHEPLLPAGAAISFPTRR